MQEWLSRLDDPVTRIISDDGSDRATGFSPPAATRDVVTQISAASKALDQTGFLLVAAGLRYCVADPERSSAEGYDLATVQKMFLRLA